uniref:Ferritin n=1 Tax=Suricata suricatta TaxID=37032 RepID=A0A673UUP6_SURSU
MNRVPSQVPRTYPQDSEAAINRQIDLELHASYVHLSMSYYFDRDDAALKDFDKYFRHQSHEGRERAEKLMELVNQSLLELRKRATDKNDPHLRDFIETHYPNEQVKAIKELGDCVSNLRGMGAPESGRAEYLLAKHALGNVIKRVKP